MGTKKNTPETFTAKYRNQCAADCGTWVQIGDSIQFQLGGVVHDHCHDPFLELTDTPDDDTDQDPIGLRKGEQVCPSCWLVHRGECF